MPKFNLNTSGHLFDALNALRLAQLSNLVYSSLQDIEGTLKNDWGFAQYKYFDVNDTQAFIVANEGAVIIVFRGTVSCQDWCTDLKIKLMKSNAGRVHCGFNQALDCIWEDLYATVTAWKGPDQPLWITGHSLGGALATLAVDRLTDQGVEVSGLYTYGQPCVGDKKFAENFNRKMKRYAFRFTNDEDIVTRLLPFTYCHIGTGYFFDNKGRLYEETWWNVFKSRAESVSLRSSEKGSSARAMNPGGLNDHSLNFYIKYLGNHLSKQKTKVNLGFIDYINITRQ